MKDVNQYNSKLRIRSNFVMLPVNSIFDKRLKKVDFKILTYLSLLQGNNDGCWVSVGYLSALLGFDYKNKKVSIKEGISNLENLGYLRRLYRFSKKHQSFMNFYQIIFKEPSICPELDLNEINMHSIENEEFDEEFKTRKKKIATSVIEVYSKNKFLNKLIEETININYRFSFFYYKLELHRPLKGKLKIIVPNAFTKEYFTKNFLKDMLKAANNLNYSIKYIEVKIEGE